MNFRVHFIHDECDCVEDVDAVNAEAAAKQIRREFKGAIIKKTKVIREK